MAIEYFEMDGWPKQRQTRDGFSATRKVVCSWANVNAVEDFFIEPDHGLGEIYPYKPNTGARVFSVNSGPLSKSKMSSAGGNSLGAYDTGVVTVQYRTPRAGDPLLLSGSGGSAVIASQHFETAGENLILPYEDFQWHEPTKAKSKGEDFIFKDLKPAEAPTKFMAALVYVLTLYNRPGISVAALNLINHVNNSKVDANLLHLSFPRGSLLFDSVSHELGVPLGGGFTGAVTYRFTIREHGWNQFWNPRVGAFLSIYLRGESEPYENHPEGDFEDLN